VEAIREQVIMRVEQEQQRRQEQQLEKARQQAPKIQERPQQSRGRGIGR